MLNDEAEEAGGQEGMEAAGVAERGGLTGKESQVEGGAVAAHAADGAGEPAAPAQMKKTGLGSSGDIETLFIGLLHKSSHLIRKTDR